MGETWEKTLGQFFLDRVAERGDAVALREKDYGIWLSVSWSQYLEHVKHFALGLKELGFERGDHLAILSENCREWLYAELGAICLGGVSLGVYPTSPYPEVHYVVKHSDSVFVVCEDQEQTDKILEVIDDLPLLRKIIVKDMKGLRRYPKEHIMSFAEVEELGRAAEARDPELFYREVDKGEPEDVCIMVYTSGTTGKPKGAMISHRNVVATAQATAEAIEATPEDSVVSYLPLCHVAEKIFSLFLPMRLGYTVNFAESIGTIQSDLREIAPTVVPRGAAHLGKAPVIHPDQHQGLQSYQAVDVQALPGPRLPVVRPRAVRREDRPRRPHRLAGRLLADDALPAELRGPAQGALLF